jgi:hypothetical protein
MELEPHESGSQAACLEIPIRSGNLVADAAMKHSITHNYLFSPCYVRQGGGEGRGGVGGGLSCGGADIRYFSG